MDFASEGLLDGLDGKERAARERLLASLIDDGFTPEEVKAAVAEQRLALLPVDRVLGGRYTAAEIEEQTGLPTRVMLRIRRLLGLPEAGPEDRIFSDDDIQAAQSTRLFLEAGISEEKLGEMTRVLGEAMGRVAGAATAVFLDTFLEPGDTEHDVARRFAMLTEKLTPALDPVLVAAYKAHLRESVRRGMISSAELAAGQAGDAQELTICFADIVGFTRLGGELQARELGTLAAKLAELAAEVTEPPARVVKTIGDAAMLVSPDPAAIVVAALSLVEAAEAADLPTLRAGLASGPVLPRFGDVYGNAVNVASRVTGIARPGSVLCTREIYDAAPEAFDWSFAGRHRLRGVAEAVPLYRARRLEQPAQPAPEAISDDARKRSRAGRRQTRASR